MIITIGGKAFSGKSTVRKRLAERLGYKSYSMGDIRREYARNHEMTIEELNKKAETDHTSDRLADEFLAELGKTQDRLVIDTRLGFHFIPNSFKVYLYADDKKRGERAYEEKREKESYSSAEEAIKKLKERDESDLRRYEALYRINPNDLAECNYDLTIDTTNYMIDEVVDIVWMEFTAKHDMIEKAISRL